MNKSLSLNLKINTTAERIRTAVQTWFGEAVLIPFAATRIIWLLVAWFARYFPTSPTFQRYVDQGGFISDHYLLDIWSRWDSRWYMFIIKDGYFSEPVSVLTTHRSNLPFFPLYPYLVKWITEALPVHVQPGWYLLVGLLISNLCFLIAAGFLYRLIADHLAGETIAKRVLLLIFAFPTSFIFSTFYPESLYLMLCVISLWLAYKGKWAGASLAAALAGVCRPQGILLALPLALLYLQSIGWRPRSLRWNVAWLAVIPLPLAAHFISLYPKTGTYIAPILAQGSWRSGGSVFQEIVRLVQLSPSLNVWQIDAIVWAFFAVILLAGARRLRSWPMAAYALAQLVLPASTGSFMSFTRFAVTIFPIFIILAQMLKRRSFEMFCLALFFAFQVLYFLGWVNYFWIA
jgi:hypothetical protein